MSEDIHNNPDILLQVKNLEVTFTSDQGSVVAVKKISFTIKKGGTLGIVGESGSGKSVTSLSIMRLIQEPIGQITNGEILFRSQHFGKIVDLTKLDKKDMREIRGGDIAMIFQEPMSSLNPVYTCGNQVIEAIQLHQEDILQKENKTTVQQITKKEAKQRALDLFMQVKLYRDDDASEEQKRKEVEVIFDKFPHELSGGQKQRVMIAMALSCEPSLLIADEPTTALDVTVQKKILELLDELREKHGTAIMFITHDLGVIAEVADRVMVMYKGQIMEEDTIWNVFDNPHHPYTKGLLACRPRLDLQLKVLPVVRDFMEIKDGEIIEKDHKYHSLGDAILMNFITEDEIDAKNKQLASKPPILQVIDLNTWFAPKKGLLGKVKEKDYIKAVDNVNFEIYPGETIGLVGESGSGKTTLGRTILKLVESISGKIIFEDRDLNKLSSTEMRWLRRKMQIIFQDPYSSLNPRRTVGEAITEPMLVHNIIKSKSERKKRAIELLEKVGLEAEHYNRYPHEFSGGQRQRVSIARTLAVEPDFIIADESVSALDVSVQAQVLNLLNSLKDEFNLTYIFISHDLSVVKFMSDRIIVMNKGKIAEMGYAEQIYSNPQTDYTRSLINAIPKGRLEDIRRAELRRRTLRGESIEDV